jgi:hypothetical protein
MKKMSSIFKLFYFILVLVASVYIQSGCSGEVRRTQIRLTVRGIDEASYEIADLSTFRKKIIKSGSVTSGEMIIRFDSLPEDTLRIWPLSIFILTNDEQTSAAFPLPLAPLQTTEVQIDMTPLKSGNTMQERIATISYSGNPHAVAFSGFYSKIVGFFRDQMSPDRLPGERNLLTLDSLENRLKEIQEEEARAIRDYGRLYPDSPVIYLMLAQAIQGVPSGEKVQSALFRLADSICRKRERLQDTTYLFNLLMHSLAGEQDSPAFVRKLNLKDQDRP